MYNIINVHWKILEIKEIIITFLVKPCLKPNFPVVSLYKDICWNKVRLINKIKMKCNAIFFKKYNILKFKLITKQISQIILIQFKQ